MNRHEQRIVKFLSRPESYSHPVGRILRRETHVSHVFLAGDFAYKLKKPVKFPFLDASTLERRKRFCRLELSLNRRLAPAAYLGILPITETPGGLRLGGRGRVVEWLVRMRRLPEARMLDRLVTTRRVDRCDMDRLADRLLPFFQRAARNHRIDRYGQPAQVATLLLGNLSECQSFVGRLLPETDRSVIEGAYRQYLTLAGPLLAGRVRERRIIDGHGDLRCENICLPAAPKKKLKRGAAQASLPAAPDQANQASAAQAGMTDAVIFDCVEFEPAFRCGDMANDLSFLLMDLEFRGRRDLAEALLTRYRRVIRDPAVDVVLPVYQCHRSLVRGKVRGLAWLQHPDTRHGRRAQRLARRHFRLAVQYARCFARPRLIVVGGVIGTGKSALAGSLAVAFGAVWLRTDEIRLREFARFRRPRQGFGGGLYALHVSQLVYQRLIRRAEELVRQGRSVVCDGTFSLAVGREALREIARRHGASFHFFECVAPRAVALRRLAKRYATHTDLSEAQPEHYDRLRAGFEPVNGWSRQAWTRLATDRTPARTREAALGVLRRAWNIGR